MMTHAWSELLVELPVVWDLGLRITLLLGLAWLTHLALAGSNPRWRVQLWRFASLAVLVVAITTFLPRIAISVTRAATEKPNVAAIGRSVPKYGAAWPAEGVPEMNPMSLDGVWRSTLVEYQPAEEAVSLAHEAEARRPPSAARMWIDNWTWLLVSGWGIGVGLLAVRWIVAQIRIRVLLSKCSQAPVRYRRLLQHVANRLDVAPLVELCLSKEAGVPFVAGWRRPTIVLPAHMAEDDYQQELPAILAHELTHVKSRDLFWMGVAQWVAIPIWFHPFTWRIRTVHAMACEEVADAVAAQNVGNVASYSGTLARVALAAFTHPPAVATISMARTPQIMSRLARLKRGLSNSPLAQRSVVCAAIVGLLALLPLAGIKFADAQLQSPIGSDAASNSDTASESQDSGETRVLEFPADRPVGTLSIATEKESEWWDRNCKRFDYRRDWDWKYHGLAQGKVTIPAGAKVQLTLKPEGARQMSWVAKLKPDDVYHFIVFPHPANADTFSFGDAQLRHLSHLSGLTELVLRYVQVTDRGMRPLESMQALQALDLHAPRCGNGCLRSIGKLSSLQVLSMGIMKWTDKGLLHLANLQTLEELSLSPSGSPGPGFEAVVQLPRLKYLSGYTFKNVHLAHLKGATALRALNLDSNRFITDAGLAHLADVPQLEYLDLYHTNVTEEGVQHLRPLKSLKRINLMVNGTPNGPPFTAAAAEVLSELKSLERLDLQIVGSPDEFLESISVLPNLQCLWMGGHRDSGFITDAGMKHVAKHKKLNRLNLFGTELTDEAADSLAQLTELDSLYLHSETMTDAGIAKLKGLKKLVYLHLNGNPPRGKFTFSGASHLNGLPHLNELWYYGSPPTPGEKALDFSDVPELEKVFISGLRNKDLAGLVNCKKLRWLGAGDVTNAGLAHVAGMTRMERLTLHGDGITDAGLVHLDGMTQLHDLDIHGSLTDEGLRHLEKFKSLGTLRLSSTGKFSPGALAHLREKLPGIYRFSIDQDRAASKAKKDVLQVGQPAPPFKTKSLEGREISVAGYRGKVLLLYFWSTNCAPCVASMPHTVKAYEELSKHKDFAMVSLSGDTNDLIVRKFVKEYKLTWPQVRIGEQSHIAADYGVTGFPSYVLIGRDGKILCTHASQLDAALREALDVKNGT